MSGNVTATATFNTSAPPGGGRTTYGNGGNPWAISATGITWIEAENYDQGGDDVGWIVAGEWLEYTVNVASAGTYTLHLRVARQPSGNGAVKVLFGGVDKTGDITVPSTGGCQTWTMVAKTVTLSAGQQVMRIAMDASDFNIDWVEVRPGTN